MGTLEFQYFRFFDQGEAKTNMCELNKLLTDGWYPVREIALNSVGWAGALILLERRVEN